MKRYLLLFAMLFSSHAGLVEKSKPALIRIVVRTDSKKIVPGSFGAKPRTIYIGGDTFSRIEEAPDPELNLHQLIITSEPDLRMINLLTKQGMHIVDPGPTFVTHCNIFAPDAPGALGALEFGKEVEFFERHHTAQLETTVIEDQRCEASEFKQANFRLVLYTVADTHKPFRLDVFKEGETDYSIRFMSYETNLPFDPALFKPPGGITITDAKSGRK